MGQAPCEPKSSSCRHEALAEDQLPEPVDHHPSHQRVVAAETSHRARSSRVARRSLTRQGRQEGRHGRQPQRARVSSSQLPRGNTRIARGGIDVDDQRGRDRARPALCCFSSSASSFFWASMGFLMAFERADRLSLERPQSLGLGRDREPGRLLDAHGGFLHVGEERGQAVKLAGLVRVELVVVALGAAHGRPQPDRRNVPHAVGGILGHVFLGLCPPLLGRLEQPVIARGDAGLFGRRRRIRSPASCSIVNRSNGLLVLNAADHIVAERGKGRRGCRRDSRCVSAKRTRSSQKIAIRSPK